MTKSSTRIARLVFVVVLAAAGLLPPHIAAQSTNPIQAAKDAWKKAREQQKQQQQKPPQQQPGQQSGQRPNSSQQATSGSASADTGAGPFTPPAGTKIDEKVMAPLQQGMQFYVSPHGVHVATVAASGSRSVVIYDGVEGPKFDEILLGSLPGQSGGRVAFSPDGKRYAYCGRLGSEFVVMVDGKELARSSESNQGRFDERSCDVGFSSNNQHVFYLSHSSKSSMTGNTFDKFSFDGKVGPASYSPSGPLVPVLSPDGNHYAYVAIDPANQERWALVVDGKVAPYQAGNPQWSADSQHLYTTKLTIIPGKGQVTDLLLDGKPIMRANQITLHVPPVGDMVVAEVVAGVGSPNPVRFLTVGNKKIPGSESAAVGEGIDTIVFSPDGKHFAAKYRNLNSKQFVLVDGKKGLEYQSVDKITFTPDSSKVVYLANATNGKPFLVIGEEELGPAFGEPVFAPVGNRIGMFSSDLRGGPPQLILDGKITNLQSRGGSELTFTPDGAHYAYVQVDAGMGKQLVVDGVVQTASNLGGAITSLLDAKYVISPDGEHIAHFALPPTPTGDYGRGIFLDGKYVPIGQSIIGFQLTFTPDGKHLMWAQNVPSQHRFRVVVDGKPVAEVEEAINRQAEPHWWEVSPDGTLMFLGQDENSLKRFSITPSPNTSLETFLAGAR